MLCSVISSSAPSSTPSCRSELKYTHIHIVQYIYIYAHTHYIYIYIYIYSSINIYTHTHTLYLNLYLYLYPTDDAVLLLRDITLNLVDQPTMRPSGPKQQATLSRGTLPYAKAHATLSRGAPPQAAELHRGTPPGHATLSSRGTPPKTAARHPKRRHAAQAAAARHPKRSTLTNGSDPEKGYAGLCL